MTGYLPFGRDVVMATPLDRGAKEFEADIVRFGKSNRYTITIHRNGVMASMFKGKTVVMKSYPDFEGCLNEPLFPGSSALVVPFVIDAKVCRKGRLDNFTRKGDSGYHQVRYMMRKAAVGEVCGFVIYYPGRALKTRTDPPGTFWIPVHPAHSFWEKVKAGEAAVISRATAAEIGYEIPWISRDGKANPVPDIAHAVMRAAKDWFNKPDRDVLRKGWKLDNDEEGDEEDLPCAESTGSLAATAEGDEDGKTASGD